MKYLGLIIAFLFAFALYAFAFIGIMDTFIVGDEPKTEHTMQDYLKQSKQSPT